MRKKKQIEAADPCITGRAEYKGRLYYQGGEPVLCNDKRYRTRLVWPSGAYFWVLSQYSKTVKVYPSPVSLKGLQDYARSFEREASWQAVKQWTPTTQDAWAAIYGG